MQFVLSFRNTIVEDEHTKGIILKFYQFMEYFFQEVLERKRKFIFIYHLLLKRKFQNCLWVTRDISFHFQYVWLLLRCQIAADIVRLICMIIPPDAEPAAIPLTLNKFAINYFNHLYFCTERINATMAIMVAEKYSLIWAQVIDRRPDEVVDYSKLKFGDQVLMMQLMPVIYVIKERATDDADALDKFIQEIFSKSCDFTARHLYAIQDTLRQSGECILDLACKSIKTIIAPESRLTKERAILVLKGFVCLLNDYLPTKRAGIWQRRLEKPQLLTNLLIGTHALLKRYNISWRDCIETTTLTTKALILLNDEQLSGPLAVHVLNLLQLSIESFLAPNMALLMEHVDGSGLENLGVAIHNKLSDIDWEVRDSTVQLIKSMVDISREKYLAFQNLLIESNVLPLVVHMATNDEEAYVRATAFQCMTCLVKFKLYFKDLFASGQLVVSMLEKVSHSQTEKEKK